MHEAGSATDGPADEAHQFLERVGLRADRVGDGVVLPASGIDREVGDVADGHRPDAVRAGAGNPEQR